jgi:hypothetical protein
MDNRSLASTYTSAEDLARAAAEKVQYSCLAARHALRNIEHVVGDLPGIFGNLPQPPDERQVCTSGLRDRIDQIRASLSELQPELETEVVRLRTRVADISDFGAS